MNRLIVKLAALTIAPVLFTGCVSGNSTYQPQATDMQLAVYAGQANYPYDTAAEMAPHIFASIAPDSTITLWNAGADPVNSFELWVNKLYTIHVEKLDGGSAVSIAPGTVFNKKAEMLKDVPPKSLTTIQIYVPATQKLWDVQGPILPK